MKIHMNPRELKQHLKRLGLTHQALADILHVDRATVTKWASGRHPVPFLAAEKIRSLGPASAKKATA